MPVTVCDYCLFLSLHSLYLSAPSTQSSNLCTHTCVQTHTCTSLHMYSYLIHRVHLLSVIRRSKTHLCLCECESFRPVFMFVCESRTVGVPLQTVFRMGFAFVLQPGYTFTHTPFYNLQFSQFP